MTKTNVTKFSSEYEEFIKNIGKVLDRKLSDAGKGLDKKADENKGIDTTIVEVTKEASSEYALVAMDFAASQIDPLTRERLLSEMRYFNKLEKSGNNGDPATADVVKESIEDLLGDWIPEWLKRTLKIINELLKIASGNG